MAGLLHPYRILLAFCFLQSVLVVSSNSIQLPNAGCEDDCNWDMDLLQLNCVFKQCTYISIPNPGDVAGIKELIYTENLITEIPELNFITLEALDLAANRITQVDNKSFRHLVKVEMLDLSDNLIKTFEDNPLNGMQKLYELFLDDNRLEVLSYRALESVAYHLEVLNLTRNALVFIEKGALDGMVKLQELDLSSNRLSRLDYHTFNGCPVLEQLFLRNNDIEQLEPDIFSNLTHMTKLDLSSNKLHSINLQTFADLRSLLHLDLSNNELNTLGEILMNLGSLQTLDLSNNRIKVLDPDTVRFPGGIVNLAVTRCQHLVAIEDHTFGNLTKIKTMNIDYNTHLAYISEFAFCPGPEINHYHVNPRDKNTPSSLSLVGNALQFLPESLVVWDYLDSLSVKHNNWMCDCQLAWTAHASLPAHTTRDMRCFGPGAMAGKLLSDVHPMALTCDSRTWMYLSWPLTIAITVVLSLAIAAMTVIIIMRCKTPKNPDKYSALFNVEDVDGYGAGGGTSIVKSEAGLVRQEDPEDLPAEKSHDKASLIAPSERHPDDEHCVA